MILIDASIWIDHFRHAIPAVTELTGRNEAATHPFVVGELAMGSLRDRRRTLRYFARLPTMPIVSHAELLAFVEWQQLFGVGIGLMDAHLLASARASPETLLWTRDKRLHTQAVRLEVAFAP